LLAFYGNIVGPNVDAGAAITAHENTRKHLSVATRVDGWNYTFPAVPSGAIPAKVFKTSSEMRWNDTRLLLQYYGPAHPDSDISVNFSDADVLHVGETWWNGVYPLAGLDHLARNAIPRCDAPA